MELKNTRKCTGNASDESRIVRDDRALVSVIVRIKRNYGYRTECLRSSSSCRYGRKRRFVQDYQKSPHVGEKQRSHRIQSLESLPETACIRDQELAWVSRTWLCLGRLFRKEFEKLRLRKGGDTDTNACIVGYVMGAIYGFEGMPDRLKKPVLEVDSTTWDCLDSMCGYNRPRCYNPSILLHPDSPLSVLVPTKKGYCDIIRLRRLNTR